MATLETRLYNGDRAREVLENEAFQQLFIDVKQELFTSWEAAPDRDREGREKIFMYVRLLGKLQACLQTSLDTGTLAKLDLQHRQTLYDRAKSLIGATS